MKKLLAYGLILSTLMSFGSVCFARKFRIDDDSETEIDYHYSADDEDEIEQEDTKKPRNTRGDNGDKKPKRKQKKSAKQKEKEHLIYLRNKVLDLAIVYYSKSEMVEMKIGDLNDDRTVLTVNGESQELPDFVFEAIRDYLALREKLAPSTMGAEKPLFVDCYNPMKGLPMTVKGVKKGISRYHKANDQTTDMEEE